MGLILPYHPLHEAKPRRVKLLTLNAHAMLSLLRQLCGPDVVRASGLPDDATLESVTASGDLFKLVVSSEAFPLVLEGAIPDELRVVITLTHAEQRPNHEQ